MSGCSGRDQCMKHATGLLASKSQYNLKHGRTFFQFVSTVLLGNLQNIVHRSICIVNFVIAH